MYYRIAIQRGRDLLDRPSTWQWQSTVLSSLQSLFQVLRLYGALPQEHLRVFSSPSRESLEEQRVQENSGVGSASVTAAHFLQQRLIRSKGVTSACEAWGHVGTTSIAVSAGTRLDERGDAVCAFNPIYGQGMTVSALDAMTLNQCLQEQQRSPKPNFEQHFQQQLSKTVANAWLISTSEDLRWPGIVLRGAPPKPGLGLLHRYMDLVLYSAVEDMQITQAYMGVLGMVNPPLSLARPRMVARVFWSALKRMVKRLSTHENETPLALSPGALNQLHALPEMHYEQVS